MEPNESLIQNYFKESLEIKSLETMQLLLETDPSFKEEVNFYQNLQEAIHENERQQLFEKLELVEETSENPLFKKGLFFAIISIAVSLTILFFVFSRGVDTQELYSQYYETYPASINEINSDFSSRDMQPFEAYKRKEYETAAEGFRTQFEAKPQPDLQFYYTMSLLNSGSNEAEASLQLKNMEKNRTKYQPQVYWYSGLQMLKEDNVLAAKEQFNKLLKHPAKYKNREAERILKKLD